MEQIVVAAESGIDVPPTSHQIMVATARLGLVAKTITKSYRSMIAYSSTSQNMMTNRRHMKLFDEK
jgi:hypothetical protein